MSKSSTPSAHAEYANTQSTQIRSNIRQYHTPPTGISHPMFKTPRLNTGSNVQHTHAQQRARGLLGDAIRKRDGYRQGQQARAPEGPWKQTPTAANHERRQGHVGRNSSSRSCTALPGGGAGYGVPGGGSPRPTSTMRRSFRATTTATTTAARRGKCRERGRARGS